MRKNQVGLKAKVVKGSILRTKIANAGRFSSSVGRYVSAVLVGQLGNAAPPVQATLALSALV